MSTNNHEKQSEDPRHAGTRPRDTQFRRRKPQADPFDLEKTARILSLIAIPVMIAIVGWFIQNRLSDRNLSQEYVKLAVSILEKPEKAEAPRGLRDWAVELLNQNSPTKFGAETIRQLKSGEINLSGVIGDLVSTMKVGGAFAVSPDGETAATIDDGGSIQIWKLKTGLLLAKINNAATMTAVAYAPDGQSLYSGSIDGEVDVWDLSTGRKTMQYRTSHAPIEGLAFTPNGRLLVVRTADRHLLTWAVPSGQVVSDVQFATK